MERQFVKGLFLFVLVAWPSFLPANGDDCNANGVDDELDLASGTSADCDANGVPDECDLAPTLDFPSAQHLAAGLRPLAVLSADLNGDDRPDLVALSSEEEVGTNGGHAVSWLLNRGDREFETARRIFVSSDPASPVAEDLDADGDLDLALIHKRYNCCSDDAPNFTILTNDGSGNLDIHDARRIANATATLCAGDFDSDGRMDLAVGPTSALRIDILRNEGDLEFSQESFTIEMPPAILKSGDIDGDSILDLVVAYEGRGGDSGVAALLLGDGAAGFSLSRRVGAGAEPMGMILEDLDRDSDLDIAVACAGSWEVVVSSNPGTGIFVWPSRMDMGGRAVALASADMDLDGDPDIVVGEQGSPVLIFLENSGTGTFPGRFDHVVNGYPYTVDLSDLDGDGDPDVSTPYVDGNAVAITWNGHGRLESARSQRIGGAGPGAIEAGDFDGDGLIDIVIVTANSVTRNFGFLVMASAGDGTFEGPVFHNNLTPIGEVAVIEATGDGRPDLITTNQEDGSISLFINEGGTFTRKAMSTFPGYKPFFVRPIDLDGDVHPDLALLDASESQQATVGLLFSSGDGTFRRGRSFQTGPYPGSLACGDFDGDGDGDVAVTGVLSRSLWVSRNTGDAVFELDTELRTGERPLSMGVGDLDGDGRLDLCIGNTDSSDVSLFFQEAAGGLRAGPRIPVGERPRAFAIADLDRDGNTDVLVANEHSNSVSILLGDGDGSFTRDEELEVDRQPVALFAGDIDGDEHLDICAVGQAAGRITILRKMLLPPPSADCDSNGVPDECDVAAGGDLDSNGILDSCELPRFRRGDPNDDGTANISDSLRIFGFLFIGDQTLHCKDAGDANDDGSLDITDGIFLLEFLFGSGRPVPPPGHLDCGVDPGPPAGNPLGCDRYERC